MTNQERAEKIAEWILDYIKGSWTLAERKRVSELVTSHLNEAVLEAEEPWKILCENQLVGLKVASECERIGDEIAHKLCEQDCECSKKGFASAQEKAEESIPFQCDCGCAERIRNMTSETSMGPEAGK